MRTYTADEVDEMIGRALAREREQRKPLTHEQRVDLLAKFEARKHAWHAPAILIDMVEAAHGIKGDA